MMSLHYTVFTLREDLFTLGYIIMIRDGNVEKGILRVKTNKKSYGNLLLLKLSYACRYI